MIGIGAYAAVRLVIIPMLEVFSQYKLMFSVWALLTMVYGGLMALAQDDIKKLLAYSSVSQMGYIFLGLSSATSIGLSGAIFHYVTHGLAKGILFSIAGILIVQTGTRSIKELGGLIGQMPLTGALCIIGFFGISGIPPTIGFMSKWVIFLGLFTGALEHSVEMIAIAVISILMTVITLGYSLWTIWRIFFGPLPEHLKEVKEAPPIMTVPPLVLAVASLILGIFPGFVTDFIARVLGG